MTNGSMEPIAGIVRTEPDLLGTELEVQTQFLEYHRATLRMKCAGLTDAQLRHRPIATTGLTLLGLLRHATEVERSWFAVQLDGQSKQPFYFDDSDPNGDFDSLDSASVEEVWTTYDAMVAESRRIMATFADGGDLTRGTTRDARNVRWVLAHLLEEYARHNGHADLLREAIDGVAGE